MKMYLVKEVSVATEKNRTFGEGYKTTYYTGKNGKMLACIGDLHICQRLTKWGIREYGYKRECDARKSYSYKSPENTEYWKSTAEVIAVTV